MQPGKKIPLRTVLRRRNSWYGYEVIQMPVKKKKIDKRHNINVSVIK